jgi:hypothetical protein
MSDKIPFQPPTYDEILQAKFRWEKAQGLMQGSRPSTQQSLELAHWMRKLGLKTWIDLSDHFWVRHRLLLGEYKSENGGDCIPINELVAKLKADAERTLPPSACPADPFSEKWPLGMFADLGGRRVKRGVAVADLGRHQAAWEIVMRLAKNHPKRTPPKSLWRRSDTELPAVYVAVSTLRHLLAPLGVSIPHPGSQGYLLTEVSAGP